MNIFISGAQGFVGSYLCDSLLAKGHRVVAVGRSAQPARLHSNYTYLSADTSMPGDWQSALQDTDAVVNLAGRSIFTRWSAEAKRKIRDSRILTTRHIVEHLPAARPVVLLSASGVGHYGDRGADVLTEEEPAGTDFMATLSVGWETEAMRAADRGARVVCMRFGIILGAGGGALASMVPAFRWFAGGRLGSGRQWFPWLHIEDLICAVEFVLQRQDIAGAVNFCAPTPVTNSELTRTLANVLNRPAFLPAPAFMLRLMLGEFAEVLLGSQRAVPGRLTESGFQFRFPQLRAALEDVLSDQAQSS